jgi:hypothetical protein
VRTTIYSYGLRKGFAKGFKTGFNNSIKETRKRFYCIQVMRHLLAGTPRETILNALFLTDEELTGIIAKLQEIYGVPGKKRT